MYKIAVEPQNRLVSVTLGGMMTVDEVGRYIADLRHAFSTHRLAGDYLLLLDVSACPIQSQDMMKAMGEQMVQMPKARAIAVIAAGSLARMQARRLFTQSYARVVATMEAGLAWILHGTEPDAAAA